MRHDDSDRQAEPDAAPPEPADAPAADTDEADWVGAAGVSGEQVVAGERTPRLHWALMILGPIGLAVAIVLSLWSSGRKVQRSVNVQVETTWAAGEQLAVRTQIIGGDLEPLAAEVGVSLAVVDTEGRSHELGELESVGRGLAQGSFTVPELTPGEAELVVHFDTAGTRVEPFAERLPIEVVAERGAEQGRQVVSEHMLQWADDTDEQPEKVRVDLRPVGRLLAGFHNELFVRVTDPEGEPWEGAIQVALISGEFGQAIGKPEQPPVVHEGPVDELGLARLAGELRSDVVRFEVRLRAPEPPPEGEQPANPKDPYAEGPRRKLRFVSHAGTVRVRASTDFAHPGEDVTLTVEAISARKPAFVDVHGPGGAWIDTFTPPLVVPQERAWTIPARFADAAALQREQGALIQFEAYQSTLRPEDSSALARVQLVPAGVDRAASIAALIERQRRQLSLPRVDKQFEIERERAYLRALEARAAELDDETVARVRAFLLGSLEAVVYGPPQALNTRAREDEALAAFKRRWTMGVRWFLLGGGGLFILVMAAMVWRNQRKLESQTSDALGLARGSSSVLDEEALADQSLAIMRSRRQILARGVLTIALMVAALLLTVAMLESLVWDY